jgi:hypothetical protein
MESSVNRIVTDLSGGSVLNLQDATAAREKDFEVIALQVLRVCYPNCHIFRFRPTVTFEDVSWCPDVAIVERTHRYWFVVEVELGSHHLEKHVIPQALGFVQGEYGADAIAILSRELKIAEKEAATLVHYIPRYVAVVSNQPNDVWTRKLQAINVQHVAIASYQSASHDTAHAIHGFLVPSEECLGFGRVRATDNAIVTRSQEFWKNGDIQVISPFGINTWTCTAAEKVVWLTKKAGLIEFPDNSIIQVLQRSDGSLLFRLPYAP